MKITNYAPPTSDISSGSKTVTNTTSSKESFEDVLVLNQSALKAMTIDAMIAESPTGSISPDAVNAAAIMKFRSTLTNVVAPIPTADTVTSAPASSNVSANTTTSNSTASSDTNTNTTPNTSNSASATTGQTSSSSSPTYNTSIDISDVYNSGSLVCSDELNTYFKEAADLYDVDVKLLKAIAKAESNFNPSDTSSAGAMGIMQLMPNTAKELGVTNAYDARQCIMGGAHYIADKIKSYDGDLTLALAAYNAGSGNVKKYGGVPPFTETQNYIKKVLGYYNE